MHLTSATLQFQTGEWTRMRCPRPAHAFTIADSRTVWSLRRVGCAGWGCLRLLVRSESWLEGLAFNWSATLGLVCGRSRSVDEHSSFAHRTVGVGARANERQPDAGPAARARRDGSARTTLELLTGGCCALPSSASATLQSIESPRWRAAPGPVTRPPARLHRSALTSRLAATSLRRSRSTDGQAQRSRFGGARNPLSR